jgi:hypothetical protein
LLQIPARKQFSDLARIVSNIVWIIRMSDYLAEDHRRAAPNFIERASKGVHKLAGTLGKPQKPMSPFEKVTTSLIADASLCATGFLMGRGSIHGWEVLVGFAVPLYMLWLVASEPGEVHGSASPEH